MYKQINKSLDLPMSQHCKLLPKILVKIQEIFHCGKQLCIMTILVVIHKVNSYNERCFPAEFTVNRKWPVLDPT